MITLRLFRTPIGKKIRHKIVIIENKKPDIYTRWILRLDLKSLEAPFFHALVCTTAIEIELIDCVEIYTIHRDEYKIQKI